MVVPALGFFGLGILGGYSLRTYRRYAHSESRTVVDSAKTHCYRLRSFATSPRRRVLEAVSAYLAGLKKILPDMGADFGTTNDPISSFPHDGSWTVVSEGLGAWLL